jgi:transcriptional regulator with XRE-family HTH domain
MLFEFRKVIGENLLTYIRLNGYSKLSFSKLTGVSRPTLDKILAGESTNSKIFEEQIEGITSKLNLSKDYFLQEKIIQSNEWQTPSIQYSDRGSTNDRSSLAKKILEDLDDLLDIAPFYLK